jgi:dihydroxycyclohexadiene carboxylate dehydrogenase
MIHPDRFKNKVMIVTGAAQGIGRGVALAAAREGAQLVLADRSPLVHEVAQEAAALGAQVVVAKSTSRPGPALPHWPHAHSRITAASTSWSTTSAAPSGPSPSRNMKKAQIEAEIRRSLFPTLWCCRAVLPAMIAARAGAIVNVSSVATRGIYRIPYSAAKGGINALTASLAFEHAGDGIRVNAVATGGTEAPPRKVPRNPNPLSEREQVWYQGIVDQTTSSEPDAPLRQHRRAGGAILFLASSEASYITGTVLPVGGGDQG